MDIEHRLLKLERETRRWRAIALATALVLGVTLSCTQGTNAPTISPSAAPAVADDRTPKATPGNLRATSLEIVNRKGQTVADLVAGDDGASLRFYATDQTTKMLLSTSKNPFIFLSGNDSSSTLSSGHFKISPADSAKRIRQREIAERAIGHVLSDKDRELDQEAFNEPKAVEIGIGDDDGGFVRVNMRKGPAGFLGCGEAGGGILNLFNPLGKVVASVQSNKTNQGAVYVNNVNGDLSKALSAAP